MKTQLDAPSADLADRDLLQAIYRELIQTRLLVGQLAAIVTGEPVRVPLPLHL